MQTNQLRAILFTLVVTLLVVISARFSPGSTRRPIIAREDLLYPDVTYTPAPEVTETPEPEPTVNIHSILPDLTQSDWELKLVNSKNILASTFAPPEGVTEMRDSQFFDSRAAEHLEAMLSGAEEAGYTVAIRNGYRPYRTQAYLFNGRATVIMESQGISLEDAEQQARSVVAYPGTSEHQLGLCVDIMDSLTTPMIAEEVEELPVLLWLKEHCAEYGFILRYPKDKQELTGWYEPWHFRYVGKQAAEYIMENGLCLEEFLAMF